MMELVLENIPDDLYQQLQYLANANGRSIEEEVLAALRRLVIARPAYVETVLARARQTGPLTTNQLLSIEDVKVG